MRLTPDLCEYDILGRLVPQHQILESVTMFESETFGKLRPKKFYQRLVPGANVIKLFAAVSYEFL
jgi:hypothetical protein